MSFAFRNSSILSLLSDSLLSSPVPPVFLTSCLIRQRLASGTDPRRGIPTTIFSLILLLNSPSPASRRTLRDGSATYEQQETSTLSFKISSTPSKAPNHPKALRNLSPFATKTLSLPERPLSTLILTCDSDPKQLRSFLFKLKSKFFVKTD